MKSYETLKKQKEKNSCRSRCCLIIIKYFLSLSIWGNMIWLILLTKKDKNSDMLIPILGMTISYILYFIFEICSPTLSLLLSIITDKDINEVISDFMQAAPDINFTCFDEIYNGHKIASHKFPYKFCMDNSEKSNLNNKKKKGKYFFKLIINREILLNDDETLEAFSQKKKEYSQEIESGKRWVDISFFGLKNTYLINIENKCLFSYCFVYIIFIFLTLGEIYEFILWCITVEKTITIKKIITIKDEFKFPVHIANEIESKNSSEKKNENEIILHNNGKKLMFKNSIGKYVFKNNTLKNNQSEKESNRSSEKDHQSIYSTINVPYEN